MEFLKGTIKMGNKQGQIELHLAERSKPGKESFNYRSSFTEHWVSELPVGNIGETAKRLFNALQEVNRLDISWKDRLNFLELLREPISYVQNSLVRHYTGMSFPLHQNPARRHLGPNPLFRDGAGLQDCHPRHAGWELSDPR
jgi:hypothetical protein